MEDRTTAQALGHLYLAVVSMEAIIEKLAKGKDLDAEVKAMKKAIHSAHKYLPSAIAKK